MTFAVLIANPMIPAFMEARELLTIALVAAAVLWGAAIAVRAGWKTLGRFIGALVLACGAGFVMLSVSVIVACGWCCEVFAEWLCEMV